MTELRFEKEKSTETDSASPVYARLYEELVLPHSARAAVLTETDPATLPRVSLVDNECCEVPPLTRSRSEVAEPQAAGKSSGDITSADLVELLGAKSFRERETAMQSLLDRGSAALDALADGLGSESAEIRSRSRRLLETIVGKAILPGSNEKQLVHLGEVSGEQLEKSLQSLLTESPGARQERSAVLEKYLEIAKKQSDPLQLKERVTQSLSSLENIDAHSGSIYLVLAGSNRWPLYQNMAGKPVSPAQLESSRRSGIEYLLKALSFDPEICKARAFESSARVFDAAADPKFRAAVKLAHEKSGEPITDAEISENYSANSYAKPSVNERPKKKE